VRLGELKKRKGNLGNKKQGDSLKNRWDRKTFQVPTEVVERKVKGLLNKLNDGKVRFHLRSDHLVGE
jgi:hypothetical protein